MFTNNSYTIMSTKYDSAMQSINDVTEASTYFQSFTLKPNGEEDHE
jgi:hypothetical protein